MRAKDFLSERRQGKPNEQHSKATPGAYTNNGDRYYGLYRASMLMARAPGDDADIDTDSVAAKPYIGAYTPEEKKMIDAAHKALGLTTETEAEGPSGEMDDTNKQSPVTAAKWQRKKK
jgi:hypothetical protein